MRAVFARLHRWVGLTLAVFLFISGTSGALIAFEHDLDVALNPELYIANSSSDPHAIPMSVYEIADLVESRDARLEVGYLPLTWTPGHTALLYVNPRIDPSTGEDFVLGYDQVFVDPVTGEQQGTRTWGEITAERKGWIPMLYLLHFTMLLPDKVGVWLMGCLAMAWTIDCFIALYLSFPNRKLWRRSLQFRLRQGAAKLNFDLHRSGGVWLWVLVLMLAVTSIWMNLATQLVNPLIDEVSPLRETPFDADIDDDAPDVMATITREQVGVIALAEARARGIEMPLGAMNYVPKRGLYSIGFFHAEEDHAGHGEWSLTPPYLYIDGATGEVVGSDIPWTGGVGAHFVDLQFPLHSGRIMGTPGKIIVSVLGVVVAMLSVTGVIIWARKQRRRRSVWCARTVS